MASRVPRAGGELLVAAVAVSSALLALLSRRYAVPTVATSPVVLLAMFGCVVALARVHLTLGPGWVVWRHVLMRLAALAVAYPGLWALASLVSARAPGGWWAWVGAVVAGVAHLPMVAAFSVVPLLAVEYLGQGAPRWPMRIVGGLGLAAATAFALFFDDFDPLVADAPFV